MQKYLKWLKPTVHPVKQEPSYVSQWMCNSEWCHHYTVYCTWIDQRCSRSISFTSAKQELECSGYFFIGTSLSPFFPPCVFFYLSRAVGFLQTHVPPLMVSITRLGLTVPLVSMQQLLSSLSLFSIPPLPLFYNWLFSSILRLSYKVSFPLFSLTADKHSMPIRHSIVPISPKKPLPYINKSIDADYDIISDDVVSWAPLSPDRTSTLTLDRMKGKTALPHRTPSPTFSKKSEKRGLFRNRSGSFDSHTFISTKKKWRKRENTLTIVVYLLVTLFNSITTCIHLLFVHPGNLHAGL